LALINQKVARDIDASVDSGSGGTGLKGQELKVRFPGDLGKTRRDSKLGQEKWGVLVRE